MTQTLAISCSEHATVRSQTRAPGAVGRRGRWWISIKLSRSTLDDHRWPVNAAREVRSRCVEKATQARAARASFVLPPGERTLRVSTVAFQSQEGAMAQL